MSGVIDDTRKLIQDLVAPDLKAIRVQLAAIEKSILNGFSASEKIQDARLSALEAALNAKHDVLVAQMKTLEAKVDSNHASVLHSLDIDRRLGLLERLQRDTNAEQRQH